MNDAVLDDSLDNLREVIDFETSYPFVLGSPAHDPCFYRAKHQLRADFPNIMVAIHEDEIIVTNGVHSLRVPI